MTQLTILGGGIAGLAAGLAALERGWRVRLIEAAPVLGGRCRSFTDPRFTGPVDAGAHVLMGANRAALAFIAACGAQDGFEPLSPARLPRLDLASGALHVARGPLFLPPGLSISRYALDLMRLVWAKGTIAGAVDDSPGYRDLWAPMCRAVLNTAPDDAAAAALRPVLWRLALGGERGARLLIPRAALSEILIAPAARRLAALGGEIITGRRITQLAEIPRPAVLAVPEAALRRLLPLPGPPMPRRGIINLHWRVDGLKILPGGTRFLALGGGLVEWLVLRPPILSATIGCADALLDQSGAALLTAAWAQIAPALGLPPAEMPPAARCIKERAATRAALPGLLRPALPVVPGLAFAGDWTDPALPDTIDAAVRSGRRAVARLMARP